MNEYLKSRMDHIQRGRPLAEKKKYTIPKISEKRKKKIAEQKAAPEVAKENLEKWYSDIAFKHSIPGLGGCRCMECGEWIPEHYIRHATAHLLSKKLFKSVATHELNYLILGAGCGCHEKSHRIDKFVTLKMWPEAARRIKIMMPLLPHDELKYVSNQLLIALDNTD